ncbi:hypothetical protein [Companilactobacillus zhongbaensis]|uniref:hypothetical protein n=1 Tax=Companilactobacillus zhongbaensis TaxID=2486009 RepID=UPI000F78660D|nr:hypothetical protein [Companilactobacillus zhongbaensis]
MLLQQKRISVKGAKHPIHAQTNNQTEVPRKNKERYKAAIKNKTKFAERSPAKHQKERKAPKTPNFCNKKIQHLLSPPKKEG